MPLDMAVAVEMKMAKAVAQCLCACGLVGVLCMPRVFAGTLGFIGRTPALPTSLPTFLLAQHPCQRLFQHLGLHFGLLSYAENCGL